MTTEQKIRDAFDATYPEHSRNSNNFVVFKTDYLALLMELLPTGNYAVASVNGDTKHMIPTYMLPEGVSNP